MEPSVTPPWHERANVFFSLSGSKLKEAGQSAGSLAKDAKGNVADVAEKVGSAVKSRWAVLREPSTRHHLQESLITAAATTGMLFRKGITETKEKVAVGKTKVEEVAKKTARKSKTLLNDIERWQKGVASTDVFGVPIELSVQRQQSPRAVPRVLENCADFLIKSGLTQMNLFKEEGNRTAIQELVSLYNSDHDAALPEGVKPIDAAFLIKCYLASIPEPLTTFKLYDELKAARYDSNALKNVLKTLQTVNYMTLEFITALLLRVSQKSPLNKMDARSLASEMAPVIMWKEERRPEAYRRYWSRSSEKNPKMGTGTGAGPGYSDWDLLADEGGDASSRISLDDGVGIDFAAIEVVQCLIEQHNVVFTDANATVWR